MSASLTIPVSSASSASSTPSIPFIASSDEIYLAKHIVAELDRHLKPPITDVDVSKAEAFVTEMKLAKEKGYSQKTKRGWVHNYWVSLADFDKRMIPWEMGYIPPKIAPSGFEQILQQILHLKSELQDFAIVNRTRIQYITPPITLIAERGTRSYSANIGELLVRIDFSSMTDMLSEDGSNKIYIEGYRDWKFKQDTPHPHVNHGNLCLGAGKGMYRNAARAGDINTMVDVINGVLATYDGTAAHRRLSSYVDFIWTCPCGVLNAKRDVDKRLIDDVKMADGVEIYKSVDSSISNVAVCCGCAGRSEKTGLYCRREERIPAENGGYYHPDDIVVCNTCKKKIFYQNMSKIDATICVGCASQTAAKQLQEEQASLVPIVDKIIKDRSLKPSVELNFELTHETRPVRLVFNEKYFTKEELRLAEIGDKLRRGPAYYESDDRGRRNGHWYDLLQNLYEMERARVIALMEKEKNTPAVPTSPTQLTPPRRREAIETNQPFFGG